MPLIGVGALKDLEVIDQCWPKICKKMKRLNSIEEKEEEKCECIP